MTVNGQAIAPATYYPTDSIVSITATASNGWSFLNWQGDAGGTNNPLNVMMNQTNNLQAVFGTVVGTNAIGGGGIVLNLANPVAYGTLLTASAVPNAGQFLKTWSGAVGGTNSPTTLQVTTPTPTVNALFTALPGGKDSLAVVVAGNGAVTVSPQQSYYNPGDVVTLHASTSDGITTFSGWTGGASGNNNPLAVTVNSNLVVQANFVGITLRISPQNQNINVGQPAAFSVSAVGTTQLYYQWFVNGAPIAGATNASYGIASSLVENSGSYYAVITNITGSLVSGTARLTVNPAAPIITSPPAAAAITCGQTLASSTLSGGSASVPGAFQFQNAAMAPNAGSTNAWVIFLPADSTNYTTAMTTASVNVGQAPLIATASSLKTVYSGTPFSGGNGVIFSGFVNGDTPAVLGGTLSYGGTAQGATSAGVYTIIPSGLTAANYAIIYANGTLTIDRAGSLVTVIGSTNFIYDGSAQGPTNATVTGSADRMTFGYASVDGTTYPASLNAPTNAGNYTATVTVAADAHYGSATTNAAFTIHPATPVITWNQPTPITYGTALDADELNATANVAGTLVYSPTNGTILRAGTNQILNATFTPGDTNDYSSATNLVFITVLPAPTTVTIAPSASEITYGQTLASSSLSGGTASVPGRFAFADATISPDAGVTNVLVSFTPADTNDYIQTACTVNVAVNQASATVTLANLTQAYDGTPKPVTTTTIPPGLTVNVTYNGSNGVPSAIGSYAVIGTINDPNFYGSATNILVIHAVLPFITQQPANQTAVVGSPANFLVMAGGTGPFGYQWLKDGSPLLDGGTISGSGTSNLTVSAVAAQDGGSYSVVVTNAWGGVPSSNAWLTVNAQIYLVGTNVVSGSTANVPVMLDALGEEAVLQFSLSYNPAVLAFVGIDSQDFPWENIIVVTNSASLGQIGFLFYNFSGYAPGGQTLVNVTFMAQPVTGDTVSSIAIGDTPTTEDVIDSNDNDITNVVYAGNSVLVTPAEYAADVYPYPDGDSTVNSHDWLEMGRLVTGLDAVTSPDLMLRADCAPRGNPDGVLTVADWVQAGRYASGLDPLTIVNLPGPSPQVKSMAAAHPLGGPLLSSLVQMIGTTATNGQAVTVPVNLVALGGENALGFNVTFDPTQLAFNEATNGLAALYAKMNLNTNQVFSGRLGMTLALSAGLTFTQGTNQIALLRFTLLKTATGNLTVSFAATNPVVQQVCNASAGVMTASYTPATIMDQTQQILSQPKLQIQLTNGLVRLAWPQIYSNFMLQSIGTMRPGV